MICCEHPATAFLLAVLLQTIMVESQFELDIRVVDFSDRVGDCGGMLDVCQLYIDKICLDPQSNYDQSCTLGALTRETDLDSGLPKNRAFSVDTKPWPVDFRLSIQIKDRDTLSSDDDIDDLVVSKSLNTSSEFTSEADYTGDRITLTLQFRVQCMSGYEGPHCDCVPQDNDVNGHYSCLPDGGISCLPGFTNTSDYCRQDLQAPTNVMAVQDGLTSILLTWTPSSGANGYIISYDNGVGSNGTVIVDGGFTDTLILTNLQNESTYAISVVAISDQLPSAAVERWVMLVLPPNMPTVDTDATEVGPTTISLSWSVPGGTVVTTSLVLWEITSSVGPSARAVRDDGSGSSGEISGTSYTITGLRSSTSYIITVTLINPAGNSSVQVTLSTTEEPETDSKANVAGVVVAIIVTVVVIVVVVVVTVMVMRKHRGTYTTEVQKRDAIPMANNEAYHTVSHAKAAGADHEQIDCDVICTSSNEAYHTVSHTGGTTTDYEVPDPVPPFTSHSSQLPTAGD